LSPLILQQQQSYARTIKDGEVTCNFVCDSESETSLRFTPFPVVYKITNNNPLAEVVISKIPVGTRPVGIAFNPYNEDMYVTNAVSNNTSVIDTRTNTVIDTIPVRGVSPLGIAFNPYNRDMYVTNFVSNTASAIAPLTTTFFSGCNDMIDEAVTCN
ncbi:MAG: YncE family protein, partial [Candidatus Nitrosopolaris sp.]